MVKVYIPVNLKEALERAGKENCIIFAGGTDLVVKKKRWTGLEPGFEKPVIFVSELKELKQIKIDGDFLCIGAACTCSQIIKSVIVPDIVKQVFVQMASPAIRNIATIGGNICNSSPAGDSLPLLYALDAVLTLEGDNSKREVSIEDFITGPGKNILAENEILTEIRIPYKKFQLEIYKKVGTRKSTALSKLSFIGFIQIKNHKIQDLRLAFGAVAPTVARSRKKEEEIINMINSGGIEIKKVRDSYEEIIKPINDQRSTAAYRKEVCLRILEDFLTDGLASAEGGEICTS